MVVKIVRFVVSCDCFPRRLYIHRYKISPLGVLRLLMQRWQNHTSEGKWKFMWLWSVSRYFSRMNFLWKARLHPSQLRDCCRLLLSIWMGVFTLHRKQHAAGFGIGSRWIRALRLLWQGGFMTERMCPILRYPCSWEVLSDTLCPCKFLCCAPCDGLFCSRFPSLWFHHIKSLLCPLCYSTYFKPII